MSAVRDMTGHETALPAGANSVSAIVPFSGGPPFFVQGGAGQGAVWWDQRSDDPYHGFYVSNNGLISLKAPFTSKLPIPLSTIVSPALPIIAPFWADIDTTLGGSVSYFANVDIEPTDGFGNPIDPFTTRTGYGATWRGVKTPGGSGTNTFQVVIVDRRDTGPGGIIGPTFQPFFDFDIEFNYDSIQWDAGGQFRVGMYSGVTAFEFPLSAVGGRYLDIDRSTGLIFTSHDSKVAGRYLFRVRWFKAAGAIILHFEEGLQDNEPINDFYNGGTGGFGSTGGVNVGVQFVNAIARRGGALNFGGGTMAAADGAILMNIGTSPAIINIPAGFTTEFSTSFLVPDVAGATISLFDGLNGTGALIKSATLPQTANHWQGWRTLLFGLGSATVRSITLSGTAGRVVLDSIRLGTYFGSAQLLSPTTNNLLFPNSCEDRP